MSEVYGTLNYPSDQITVEAGNTFVVGAAFERSVGLVGVGDTANGDADEGTVYEVNTSSRARTLFGEDSELQEQIDLAFLNGATRVYAVAVPVVEATETIESASNGVLGEVPALDPQLHDTSIDITDTVESASVETNIVYETPTSPTDANTANVNPVTGEIEFDESADYEITYEYGEYGTPITDVVAESPRSLAVCTENTTVTNDLVTELETVDDNFDFITGYVGASPVVDAGNYTDSFDTRRLSVAHASRAYFDEAETNMGRTVGAIAGKQAGKPLGDSTTYEGVGGFASLYEPPRKSDYQDLIKSQVLPLANDGGIFIVKDMTTSTEPKFERIFASEILDETTENVHIIAQNFIGEPNIPEVRGDLTDSLSASLTELVADDLLNGFSVAVTEGAGDFTVDVDIGADIISVIDNADINISVGDVVTNNTET